MSNQLLNKCPNCNKEIDERDLEDTIYPYSDTEWVIVHQKHNCGCGYQVEGNTLEKCLEKWNANITGT